MSEDARLGSLRKGIVEAARNERNGLRIFSMGAVLFNIGLVMSVVGGNIIAYVAGVFAIVLGTVSTVFGFYVTVHSARRYNSLLEQTSAIVKRKQND